MFILFWSDCPQFYTGPGEAWSRSLQLKMNSPEVCHTSGEGIQLRETLPYRVGAPQPVGEWGAGSRKEGDVGKTLPSS